MYNTGKIKLLIFDLDGTLADTIWSIRDGVNEALEKRGFPKRDYEQIRLAIGNGARELIRLSVPSEVASDTGLVDKVFDDYEAAYGRTFLSCDTCYDGMLEALLALKERGYAIAVLSNKQDRYVKSIVEKLFPNIPFTVACGQTELPTKPDPTVPLIIAEQMGLAPDEIAFVGDSQVDVLTAKNAGMLPVAVTWGYRSAQALADEGAEILVSDAEALSFLPKSLNTR